MLIKHKQNIRGTEIFQHKHWLIRLSESSMETNVGNVWDKGEFVKGILQSVCVLMIYVLLFQMRGRWMQMDKLVQWLFQLGRKKDFILISYLIARYNHLQTLWMNPPSSLFKRFGTGNCNNGALIIPKTGNGREQDKRKPPFPTTIHTAFRIKLVPDRNRIVDLWFTRQAC
jgi:hypothetical protein